MKGNGEEKRSNKREGGSLSFPSSNQKKTLFFYKPIARESRKNEQRIILRVNTNIETGRM
jgi:hypothetical protein